MPPTRRRRRIPTCAAAFVGLLWGGAAAAETETARGPEALAKPAGAWRVAQFNAALSRNAPGGLVEDLLSDPSFDAAPTRGAAQIAAVAEILQRVRPDVVLLNEVDYDAREEAIARLQVALAHGRNGAPPLLYAHRFVAPVNTGVRSGLDLDGDGTRGGPGDAWGWGRHPGQFGMAILSHAPIDAAAARTFQTLPRTADPNAIAPRTPDGAPFHTAKVWAAQRLSSKSHWDAPITLPDGRRLHLLASHPTPPVFDGPEDRNGLRNAAEIGFWSAYLDDAPWIEDDDGAKGGLAPTASFVILGDLNADPADGDSRHGAIQTLLADPRLIDPRPTSAGGAAAGSEGANAKQDGDPALDTADWRDGEGGPGNLRVDYVLPSRDLTVMGAGVFWPAPEDPLRRLVGDGDPVVSSDHRLVWVDIALEPAAE